MCFDYHQKVDRDASCHFGICLSSKRHISSPKGSSVCLLLLPNIVKVTFVTPFVMVYDDDVVLA